MNLEWWQIAALALSALFLVLFAVMVWLGIADEFARYDREHQWYREERQRMGMKPKRLNDGRLVDERDG